MDLKQLSTIFFTAKHKEEVKFVKSYVVDGNKEDESGKRSIFLATNGSWQTEYLSLYELLHDKYVAKFLAQSLLDKYLFLIKARHSEIAELAISPEAKQNQIEKYNDSIRFNKIVTVTVSSQLLGVAIRDIIRGDDQYAIFRDPTKANPLQASPTLLILASYYSFDEEKPFSKVTPDDRFIIVNDVISTGQLIYSLREKLLQKSAGIQAVFSIADTRIPKEHIENSEKEAEYTFDPSYEKDRFFTLCSYHDGLKMRKFKRSTFRDMSVSVKRINPLLNSIVELKAIHSEISKILYPDPKGIINKDTFSPDLFKVGHFVQNLTHHGYLTDMHNIFMGGTDHAPGVRLLNSLNAQVNLKKNEEDVQVAAFRSIEWNLQYLGDNNPELWEDLKQVFGDIQRIKSMAKPVSFEKYVPDYIFYPVFSGIEQLSHEALNNIFTTPIENIVGLQRFDTSKGWRFPFPAKRFNQLTRNKKILILDSGSLTGESLVQLIDTIAFLDVKEITLLSVISRIEDFYREFYSKLKSTKVKILRAGYSEQNKKELEGSEHVIPLSIYFGTNLHIPVYPSEASCPFCKEMEELDQYDELSKRFLASSWTTNYFTERRTEIAETNLGKLEFYTVPRYLPVLKGEVDAIELFLMRDRIGKIESFRFYPEYFEFFDDILEPGKYDAIETQRYFELVLAVLLHEPRLLDTIKDLLIEIKNRCQEIISEIVLTGHRSADSLYYSWTPYALIKLAFIFYKDRLFNVSDFEKIFAFANGDKQSSSYLSFLLWKGFFKLDKNISLTNRCPNIVFKMSENLDLADAAIRSNYEISVSEIYTTTTVRDIIKDITENLRNTPTENVNEAFYNLYKFFHAQSSNESHDELSKMISRISVRILNTGLPAETLTSIYNDTSTVIKLIKTWIFDNLVIIKGAKNLRHAHETYYDSFFANNDSIYADFEELFIDWRKIKNPGVEEMISQDYYGLLATIIGNIQDFQSQYLLRLTSFCHYCGEYRCNLSEVISHVLSLPETIKQMETRKGFSCKLDAPIEAFINGHRELLIAAFTEIITNSAKEYGNENSELLIVVENINQFGNVFCKISQEASFECKTEHQGGFYKIVRPVFETFCVDRLFTEKRTPKFVMEVTFSHNILDNFDEMPIKIT
jgi:hypothetical protein